MLILNAMLDYTPIATLTIHQLCKYIGINMYVYLKKIKLEKQIWLMVAKLISLTNAYDFTL